MSVFEDIKNNLSEKKERLEVLLIAKKANDQFKKKGYIDLSQKEQTKLFDYYEKAEAEISSEKDKTMSGSKLATAGIVGAILGFIYPAFEQISNGDIVQALAGNLSLAGEEWAFAGAISGLLLYGASHGLGNVLDDRKKENSQKLCDTIEKAKSFSLTRMIDHELARTRGCKELEPDEQVEPESESFPLEQASGKSGKPPATAVSLTSDNPEMKM